MIVAMSVAFNSIDGDEAGAIATKSGAALAGTDQTDLGVLSADAARVQSDIRLLLDAVRRSRLEERSRKGADSGIAVARLTILDNIEKAAALLPAMQGGATIAKSSMKAEPATSADLQSLEQGIGRLVAQLRLRGGTSATLASAIGSVQKLQGYCSASQAVIARAESVPMLAPMRRL